MIDRKLLREVKGNMKKEAFTPLTPEAQAAAAGGMPPGGAPPMDPAMMGGMPPMDPAMMGGMPPMDPAMMGGAPPMDPAMMGGMPPMDPAMMGGMPPMDPATGMPIDPMTGMPMDPAMMGGAPPPEEAAPGDEVVKVSMDDLKALVEEVVGAGKGGEKPSGRATNAQIMDKLSEIEARLDALMGPPPVEETGMMPPEMGAEGAPMPPASPEDITAMLQMTGMPPVQASANNSSIANLVKSLKEKKK